MSDKDVETEKAALSSVMRATARVRELVVVVCGGEESGIRRIVDDHGLAIGRAPEGSATLRLDDAKASRLHTRLEMDEGGVFWAVDGGSRNGTYVDGVLAAPRLPLRHGSVLRIGRSLAVFVDLTLPASLRLEPERGRILGNGLSMQRVRGEIVVFAPSNAPVLVAGESGTGKELVAEELHRASGRRGRFVAVNCAALPPALAESELFGHTAGAFTGARDAAEGLFVAANGGTLFLDEIAELDPAIQAKLLRVLASGEVRPLGRSDARTVDARVVAATHRDLRALVAAEDFRGDLYARLAACAIEIPPLRERREDIARIAGDMAKRHGARLRLSAMESLLLYSWPYNVRQLENVLRAAALRAPDGEIGTEHLPAEIVASLGARAESARPPPPPIELRVARDAVPDAAQLEDVLRHFEGNVAQVADYFGRDRKQIYRWADRLGIDLRGRGGGSGGEG